MSSLKTEAIARRLWKMKEEEEKKRKSSDLSSTGSDIDDDQKDDDVMNDDEVNGSATKVSDEIMEETSADTKPTQSYIALIASAILESKSKRLVLSDIYKYIMGRYPYFRSQDKSWRNSIRHNLSLNECFVKVGRSEQGKGHYWAIHPANYDDFSQGDFRRRRARRRVRRSFFDHQNVCNSYLHRPYPAIHPVHHLDYMHISPEPFQNIYSNKIMQAKCLPLPELKRFDAKQINEPKTMIIDAIPKEDKMKVPAKNSSLFTIDNILNSKNDKEVSTQKVREHYCNCTACAFREKYPGIYYHVGAGHNVTKRSLFC